MEILYYNNQKPIECISSIDNLYSVTFSKFEEKENNKKIVKCCVEKVSGHPSTFDIQQIVLNGIQEYAKTSNIKHITIQDGDKKYKGWLDSETRTSLLSTISAKQNAGIPNIVIWIGDNAINMTYKKALELIDVIELYSSDCFNIVQSKLNYIKSIDNPNEIIDYNIISGYPNNPIFIIE